MKIRTGNEGDSRVRVAVGHALSLMMITVLVIMPLTEYFWHFDEGLPSGQDFEFGLLAALVFLCLVLVVLQHGRQAIHQLVSGHTWHCLMSLFSNWGWQRAVTGLMASTKAVRGSSPGLSFYTSPLQI